MSTPDSADPTEQVPGVVGPDREPGVCQVTLSCPGEIPDEPKLSCALQVVAESGRVYYDGLAGVERRGRSSNSAPKPQYGVELRAEDGSERSEDLLGMGGDSDWVLHGNYYDRLLMRNKLAYDLFRSFGDDARYAAESAWCELTLDGTYQGVYTLVERIKPDDDRLVLSDIEDGSAFLVKHHDSDTLFSLRMTNDGFKLVWPDPDRADASAVTAVTERLQGWEQALYGPAPFHPDTGIFTWVDLDSAVDIVLLEELFKNNDAYYLSLHLWQDSGGLIHFLPWDLDLSLGQPSYNDNENPESWVLYRPDMVGIMAQAPAFQDALVARWTELRGGQLTTDAILGAIDAHQETLGDAIDRNFDAWPIETINFYGYSYPVSSYGEEDERVRAWLEARLAWMDETISAY